MNLTQKILRLDTDVSTALKNNEASILTQKQNTDSHLEQLREVREQSFENKKREDESALIEGIETERQKAIATLQKKMKTFKKEVTIDKVVEHLLSTARDRVCR